MTSARDGRPRRACWSSFSPHESQLPRGRSPPPSIVSARDSWCQPARWRRRIWNRPGQVPGRGV